MKLVRLSSGEEIVGNVTQHDNTVTITDGHLLIPAGEGKIGFMPFAPYTNAKDGVTISNNFIVFAVDPVPELAAQVQQMANPSQIITPKSQGIIV
jgi:hypothetical protein